MVIGPQPPQPRSQEDILKAIERTPLFMQNLPADEGENDAISALQSLIYEGTPDEVASNFKEQGNEYFKGKRIREALGFYTQGIDAKPTDLHLQEVLLCNRAACNLELHNYGSVLRDCAKALSLNPHASKALYRSATALLALSRFAEAIDACEKCLAFDPGNSAVKEVYNRILQKKTLQDEAAAKEARRIQLEREQTAQMRVALRERHIIVVRNPDGPSDNPYQPHFDTSSGHPVLTIPTFFLYPQHATSDLISHFREDTQFFEQLATIFPPDTPSPQWDTSGEYVSNKLVVYAVTRRKRLLKVGKKMTLKDVCSAAKGKDGLEDGLELKDNCLSFVVLPLGEVERKWVEEFKSTRDQSY